MMQRYHKSFISQNFFNEFLLLDHDFLVLVGFLQRIITVRCISNPSFVSTRFTADKYLAGTLPRFLQGIVRLIDTLPRFLEGIIRCLIPCRVF